MELMTVDKAREFIVVIRNTYGLDVDITHGGTHIMKLSEFEIFLLEMESTIPPIERKYSCMSIYGTPILNKYELLSANSVNIHLPYTTFNMILQK